MTVISRTPYFQLLISQLTANARDEYSTSLERETLEALLSMDETITAAVKFYDEANAFAEQANATVKELQNALEREKSLSGYFADELRKVCAELARAKDDLTRIVSISTGFFADTLNEDDDADPDIDLFDDLPHLASNTRRPHRTPCC